MTIRVGDETMKPMDDHTVTGRVIAVLDTVAGHSRPVSLAELTEATGIPKPTVRRIAADLVSRKMLERCADGRYQLGSHLQTLGIRAVQQQGLLHAATPHVQDLFARTGEIVWISSVTDDAIVIVDVLFGQNRSEDVRRGWPEMNRRSPALHATAAGRLLLADQPELVDCLRPHALRPSTRYTTTSWRRLTDELSAVHDTAIATEFEQSSIGYSCVASAIRGPDGTLAGMIGVTGRTGSLRADRLARPLLVAAAEASRAYCQTSGVGKPAD